MDVQTNSPFVDITNKINPNGRINKKQTDTKHAYDTLSKYVRSVNQQSERTKNTLKFMAVSREPSLIVPQSQSNNSQQEIYNDNGDMDGETLTNEKNDELISTDETKITTIANPNLEIKRLPTIHSLPSFSFSYSFANSNSESINKNKVSKEKVLVFKQKLREARRKLVMKEMILKAENMDKHSQLSITAAESLLDLTRK